jgi:glycosyltransferase involved in cell wall biosynthesis
MRVLVDAIGAVSGGGPNRVRELARTFPTLRPSYEYLFVVRAEMRSAVREIAPAVKTIVPPRMFAAPPPRLVWEHLVLPSRTSGFAPDVVFSPFNVAPTHWRGKPRLAVIVSNLCPYAPEVISRYTGTGRLRLDLLRRLTDATLRRADHIFLLSEQAWSLIDPRLLNGKAQVIPMAPPPITNVLDGSGDFPTEPYFVIATDLVRFKGVEMVIAAVGRLPAHERPLVLVCGRAAERDYVDSLRRQIADARVEEWVRLAGPKSQSEMLGLLSHARGCIAPSRFENLSRVPVEAMAAGIPVLAADVPAYRESCADAAAYFDVDDANALAQQMRDLVRDDAFHADLRARGQKRIAGVGASAASARILDAIDGGAGREHHSDDRPAAVAAL